MTLFDDLPPTPPPGTPTVRVRLLVAYHGAGFHGFAAQAGVRTVGGTLAHALARVLRLPWVELTCAGRTDRGVHAWGQVVTFDVPLTSLARAGGSRRTGVPGDEEGPAAGLDRLRQAVNKLCGPAIAVRAADLVDPTFDARFSARARLYRYTVLNRPCPDPFLADTAWHLAAPLDLRAMILGCDALIGEHDFSSFCRRPKPADGSAVSLVRRVRSARWHDDGDGVLRFWIEANAFCHQMVRSVVGTLVEMGRGKKRPGEMTGILAAADRHVAGDLAPPHGLCLWDVRYDEPVPSVDTASGAPAARAHGEISGLARS